MASALARDAMRRRRQAGIACGCRVIHRTSRRVQTFTAGFNHTRDARKIPAKEFSRNRRSPRAVDIVETSPDEPCSVDGRKGTAINQRQRITDSVTNEQAYKPVWRPDNGSSKMRSGRALNISELRERLGVAETEPPAPRKTPPVDPEHRPRIVWRREESAQAPEMAD